MSRQRKRLSVVSKDKEDYKTYANKSFSQHNLKNFSPKTFPQKQFFDSVAAGADLIIQIGAAGTGKTACAMYAALSELFDPETSIEKIIIVRTAAQAREIGFLPGTEEDKNRSFEEPYINLCDELISFKSNNYQNLKQLGLLEFKNTSFLRGLTWNNSIVILDECQNATYHELATVTTRLGKNSKLFISGDYKQVDLHKKGDVSGLSDYMEVINRIDSISYDIINYKPHDNVRSGISRAFLLAEDK